jgi:hypothetical protein
MLAFAELVFLGGVTATAGFGGGHFGEFCVIGLGVLRAVAVGAFGAAFDRSVLACVPVRNDAWRCFLVTFHALVRPGACTNQGNHQCKQMCDLHGSSPESNQCWTGPYYLKI